MNPNHTPHLRHRYCGGPVADVPGLPDHGTPAMRRSSSRSPTPHSPTSPRVYPRELPHIAKATIKPTSLARGRWSALSRSRCLCPDGVPTHGRGSAARVDHDRREGGGMPHKGEGETTGRINILRQRCLDCHNPDPTIHRSVCAGQRTRAMYQRNGLKYVSTKLSAFALVQDVLPVIGARLLEAAPCSLPALLRPTRGSLAVMQGLQWNSPETKA